MASEKELSGHLNYCCLSSYKLSRISYSLSNIYLSFLEIHKVLTKIGKEKECEHIVEWIRPCENHLMWSATSTPSGDGELIWAKFESFLSHIVNKHSNLPNGIFNKCAHADVISDRPWLDEGIILTVISNITH